MKKNKFRIISQQDLLNGAEPELAEIFSVTDEARENGSLIDTWQSDPDRLKVNGHEYLFTENGGAVILYDDPSDLDDPKMAEAMLKEFFTRKRMPHLTDIEEHSWDGWDKVKNGIAYRGGEGYGYRLLEWKD